jgi:hypothetical protein
MSKSPEALYEEREKRVNDAIALKEPDRVPIMVLSGFFPAHYDGGMTCEEAMYDYEKVMRVWTTFLQDFQPDMTDNPFTTRFLGAVLDALGSQQLKWPGKGVGVMSSYQFVEGEYMQADEYDELLYDTTGFLLRTYWPRIFSGLKGLEKLPPLNDIFAYYMGLPKFAAFGMPEVQEALGVLTNAAQKAQTMIEGAMAWGKQCRELGFPVQAGSLTQAPFDTISDFLRGTRGAMLDMFRQPDKLIEATERLLPIMLKLGLGAKDRGVPRAFIPLHKGLDGFMSPEQFMTFYWPTLKKLIEGLIAEDCTPIVFWEGDVESRLEVIGDIPKGKAIYAFERTDMFKAKEILGDMVCLKGNVPLSMLVTGTPNDIKAYCKKLIDIVGKGGGFIMDAATVIEDAKPENVKAMFDFTKAYGVYGK